MQEGFVRGAEAGPERNGSISGLVLLRGDKGKLKATYQLILTSIWFALGISTGISLVGAFASLPLPSFTAARCCFGTSTEPIVADFNLCLSFRLRIFELLALVADPTDSQ